MISIAETTLKAIAALPEQYCPTSAAPEGGKLKSPIRFADVWVGVSWRQSQKDLADDRSRGAILSSTRIGCLRCSGHFCMSLLAENGAC